MPSQTPQSSPSSPALLHILVLRIIDGTFSGGPLCSLSATEPSRGTCLALDRYILRSSRTSRCNGRRSSASDVADEVTHGLIPQFSRERPENTVLRVRLPVALLGERVVVLHSIDGDFQFVAGPGHLHVSPQFEVLLSSLAALFCGEAMFGQVFEIHGDQRIAADPRSQVAIHVPKRRVLLPIIFTVVEIDVNPCASRS
jgi:hypothetical protein